MAMRDRDETSGDDADGRPRLEAAEVWEILDDLPTRVSFVDRDRCHRYVNREYAELIGLAPEDILGHTVAEILGEEEDRRLRPFAEQALGGETVRWEGWAEIPKGTHRYIHRVYKPHRDGGGAIDGFFVLVRDTTEQEQAQSDRRRLMGLLQDAVDSFPNGFALFDADETLVMCNSGYAELMGAAPEALTGRTLVEIMPESLARQKSVAGVPVADVPEVFGPRMEKLWKDRDEPIELELKDGRWLLVNRHYTTDGGMVFVRTDITELKRMEQALREAALRFRQIVEGHPLPVTVVDLETGELLYASPMAAERLGLSWPLKDRSFITEFYVDLEDRKRYIAHLRAHGEVHGFEIRWKRRDGAPFWIAATARLAVHEGREVIIASFVDLTEEKARDAELRQTRETLEDAIESMSEGFALWDPDDRLVLCNARYRDFSKVAADLLTPGVRWEDFMRAGAERGQYLEAVGRVEEWLDERRAFRARLGSDWEFKQDDGRWFHVSLRPTRQGGIVVTRRDVTERRTMEKALRESEERFRRLVEGHPVPVILTRIGDGGIIYASPACRELFQWGETIDEDWRIHDWYLDPSTREEYVRQLHERGAVTNYELHFKKSDGTPFVAIASSRLIDFHGEETIIASIYDMTERLAVEQDLARQREALHQTEKLTALGSLLASVAHELNNPLSVVVGQALMLQETATDPATVQKADQISEAADRCARIVRTFLAMARYQPSERNSIDMNDVVDAALKVLDYSLRSSDIDVVLDLSSGLPPVRADADQLNQVITNLVINAQQAMLDTSEARRLVIRSEVDDSGAMVAVSVTDSGPGIPADIRSRIFDPFFTTKAQGTGTGIGLALSHKIIEAHDGTIEVRSPPGAGASFVVSLPVTEPPGAADSADDGAEAVCGTCRVLVVDDESGVGEMLSDILTVDGHEVETAESGVEALALLDRMSFDIVLSDIRMPNLDGPRFYEILRDKTPHLLDRIGFITGDTLSPTVATFLESCGCPYLEKPFTPAEVRDLVGRLATGNGSA